jgi:hypothetical protein
MSKVLTGASMPLDGYIAGSDESGFDLLFQWYGKFTADSGGSSPHSASIGSARRKKGPETV